MSDARQIDRLMNLSKIPGTAPAEEIMNELRLQMDLSKAQIRRGFDAATDYNPTYHLARVMLCEEILALPASAAEDLRRMSR